MPTVNAIIKRIIREKDAGIKTGTAAMRDILKELHKQVMAELGKAALGSWDAYHLRQALDAIEYSTAQYEQKSRQELSGLLDKGWNMGKAMVDAPLAEVGIYTGFHLSTSVLETLKEYSGDYLKSLFHDAYYKVKGEISLGILGQKTPQQVTEAVGTTIDAGRFKNVATRAETITGTEMGRVFSQATQLRMEQASASVPGLEKEWVHAGHPKVARPAHLRADGQRVPVSDSFNIGGVKMRFPRDPAAPLEETMHCGCDSRPYHANWA